MFMYPMGYAVAFWKSLLFLFFSLGDLFSQGWGILFGILITVVGIVLGDALLNYWKKPKIVIDVSNGKEGLLGFFVYIRKKSVKDATVRCNNVRCDWEKEDGTKCEKVDLRIGDPPVAFYPYVSSAQYVEKLEDLYGSANILLSDGKQEYTGAVLILVRELATEKIVYNIALAIQKNLTAFSYLGQWARTPFFKTSIRIVGEGIEEESDYILQVGLNNALVHPIKEGKPLMDYVIWAFEVKKSAKFFYRKKRTKFIY